MVADAANEQLEQPKKAYHGAAVKARAKALYCVKGLPPKEVAQQLGLTAELVSSWANRQGWAALKRRKAEEIVRKAEAAVATVDEEFAASIAAQSEDLTEDSLMFAREILDSRQSNMLDAAKALAAASQATKNFVGLYRQARGIDAERSATVSITAVFNRFTGPAAPSADAGSGDAIDV